MQKNHLERAGLGSIGNTSIRVDPHGGDGPYSSYYESTKNYIGLGDFSIAGVDLAEDADIILHEYGHFIQTTQSKHSYDDLTGTTEKAAMSDGFADYWAASNTYDISIKNGFDPAIWGEWSIPAIYQRRVDNSTKHYPENIVHEAHADGEIWSSVLWSLFKTLGKTTTDQIILQSHFVIPDNANFRDGAQALLDADKSLYLKGVFSQKHRDEICAALDARGISAIGCGIKIVLTWDNPGADVDLHLRGPDGVNYTGWDYDNDCAFYNQKPDWGISGDAQDNPLLSFDCITCSSTTETVTAYTLTNPGTYKVLIHYYWDHGQGPSTATIHVFEGNIEKFTGSHTLNNTDEVWEAYTFLKNKPH